jgi:hypothetical protein
MWNVNWNDMNWLVVLYNHLEKLMEFVNGKDDIPYMKWKKTSSTPPTSISLYFSKLPIVQPLNFG